MITTFYHWSKVANLLSQANREVTRMEIFLSLVRLLEPTAGSMTAQFAAGNINMPNTMFHQTSVPGRVIWSPSVRNQHPSFQMERLRAGSAWPAMTSFPTFQLKMHCLGPIQLLCPDVHWRTCLMHSYCEYWLRVFFFPVISCREKWNCAPLIVCNFA